MSLRVLLVDDHAMVRKGLRTVLTASKSVADVEEAATAREGIAKALREPFDAVVLDFSLPDVSGIEAMKLIHAQRPKLPIVMFTMHADREHCLRAVRGGALGYVSKQGAADEVVQAVQAVVVGRRFITPSIAERLVGVALAGDERAPHESLSDREFEVLRLIAGGSTPTQIAERLHLSVKTVSSHRTRVLEKLNLETTAQLIRYAIDHGLVD